MFNNCLYLHVFPLLSSEMDGGKGHVSNIEMGVAIHGKIRIGCLGFNYSYTSVYSLFSIERMSVGCK